MDVNACPSSSLFSMARISFDVYFVYGFDASDSRYFFQITNALSACCAEKLLFNRSIEFSKLTLKVSYPFNNLLSLKYFKILLPKMIQAKINNRIKTPKMIPTRI